ncbi:hypothetical protein LguiB_026207 [Lonicera macranthoides]
MQERLHSKIMEAKDSRIKATSETLKSMRVLKLHSWESTFLKKLLKLRETERSWLDQEIPLHIFGSGLSLLGFTDFGISCNLWGLWIKSLCPTKCLDTNWDCEREYVVWQRMNKALYEDVVEGCSLIRDIEMWADGDSTVVGERGMNLSGGQKQRIQLARAIYNDLDVYLLDDPFSAVDAHTGAHMFKASTILSLFRYFVSSLNDKCLMQLLCGKTVVYATHQLEFLDASDLVLVMKDGIIVQSGKYQDLIADPEGELLKQMTAHSKSLNQVIPPQDYNNKMKAHDQDNQIEVTEEKLEDPTINGRLFE